MSYLDHNPTWHDEDGAAKAREVDGLLAHLGWAPARVVDVGCGTGAVLHHLDRLLRRRGAPAQLEGWDVDAAPIGLSRHAALLRVGDALTQAAPADLALLLDVLEHLDAPERALTALPRLAPRVLLRVPVEASVRDLLRPRTSAAARQRYGHLHAWRSADLRRLLTQHGLHIDAVRTTLAPTLAPDLRAFVAEAWREALFGALPTSVDIVGGGSLLIAGHWQR